MMQKSKMLHVLFGIMKVHFHVQTCFLLYSLYNYWVRGKEGISAMAKQNSNKRTVKLAIDMILGLLYILLLGYAFTGGLFHEIAGIVFVILAVVHNIVNIRWYKALRKGTYNPRRKLTTAINIALVADAAAILVTGILNSRFLFHANIHISGIGQIHTVLALIGFVLIVFHIMVHAFSHSKKKHKKLPIILGVLTCILAVSLKLWILPYLERHFVTVEINRETAISGEQVNFEGRKILTVYFTRVGNTDFDDNIDAVSGASLLLDENQELLGNSQVIGQMIQDAAGGDILSINTEDKYPSSYSGTVSVAGRELKQTALPKLIHMPNDLDEYDTIFLVYPLWWYTIPKPVEAFLAGYDFAGKTVIPVVTHGGSGVGKSLGDIKDACNGTVVEHPLEIYCGDVPDCRERVTEWLKVIFPVQ